MVAGFANGDIDLIGHGMEDELAEPYREKMIPGYRSVKKAALAAKASGVAISGAGPSIIAIVNKRRQSRRKLVRPWSRPSPPKHVQSSYFVNATRRRSRDHQRGLAAMLDIGCNASNVKHDNRQRTRASRCEKCGGLLEVKFNLSDRSPNWKKRSLSVWKYKELLPIDDRNPSYPWVREERASTIAKDSARN